MERGHLARIKALKAVKFFEIRCGPSCPRSKGVDETRLLSIKPTLSAMNPYDVLGASPDADFATLQLRYRQLVRENHPDLSSTKPERELATARMSVINQAWAIVRDPEKRAEFNQTLFVDEAPIPRSARNEKPAPRRAKQGIAHSPEHRARARIVLAVSLFYEQNRVDEAIALCQLVLRGDFRNVPARELLGDIYAHLGETGRAQALWEQALLLAPAHPILTRKLQSLRPNSVKPSRGLGREDLSGDFRVRHESAPVANSARTALIDPMRGRGHTSKPSLWKRVLQRLAR